MIVPIHQKVVSVARNRKSVDRIGSFDLGNTGTGYHYLNNCFGFLFWLNSTVWHSVPEITTDHKDANLNRCCFVNFIGSVYYKYTHAIRI